LVTPTSLLTGGIGNDEKRMGGSDGENRKVKGAKAKKKKKKSCPSTNKELNKEGGS